jgi:hypothetical protein
MDNLTLEQLMEKIEELKAQLNQALGTYNPEPFTVRTIIASEGKVFRRKLDGMLFGKEIHLGYDYSLGFKRLDRPEFYEEVDEEIIE